MRALSFLPLLVTLGSPADAESLRVAGDRLFVPVEINGVPTEGLLDSAAEMTLIDSAFAERLGLLQSGKDVARGTGAGTQEVRFAENVDVESAGVELSGRTVAVIDLSDISRRLVGEAVSVVVGRELFDAARFYLDIENGVFTRIGENVQPAGTRVPLREHRGIKQLPLRIEGGPEVYADFDLGNGNEVLVGRSFAEEHGLLTEGRIVGRKKGGGIGGPLYRDLIVLESLTVAGARFDDVVAAIDSTENAPAANVGVPILRTFAMTIDFAGNAVWLEFESVMNR